MTYFFKQLELGVGIGAIRPPPPLLMNSGGGRRSNRLSTYCVQLVSKENFLDLELTGNKGVYSKP